MKNFTKLVSVFLLAVAAFCTQDVSGQSILNPADTVNTFNQSALPSVPPWGAIYKWKRTVRLSWNTTEWKCYVYNGLPFRLKFPPGYNPTANDGKLYPLMIFFHGAGEAGTVYDNEYSLANGGPVFTSAVDNGQFPGYVLVFQTPGNGWSASYLGFERDVANYMIANNKVDPFHIVANGLSAGGYATWGMQSMYPQYVSANMPMSGISLGELPVIDTVKFTPTWYFQGGLDNIVSPTTAQQVVDSMNKKGANLKYTLYPQLGHGTWTTAWAEPDFFPFAMRAYSSNPWTLGGRTQFCTGDPINLTVGVAPGYNAYQWRQNGVAIPNATTNKINVTALGTYDCRVQLGTIWSDWSHVPVVISIMPPTVTPPISVSGLMSDAIPDAAGNNYVNLQVPDNGYTSYTWQKVGSNTTIGTSRILKATSPGQYIVSVTQQYGCSSNFSPPFTVINAKGANPPAPAANLVSHAQSYTKIELDWARDPNAANKEAAFEIYRSGTTGGPYSYVGQAPSGSISYVDSNLAPNQQYFYVVRAIDSTAAAPLSNETNSLTQSDKTPPSAPGKLQVTTSSNTAVGLIWNSSTDNVSVANYYIYINGAKSYATTDTSFLIAGLTSSQQYSFYVVAVDGSGNVSAHSNQVSAASVLNGFNYNYYTTSTAWGSLPNFTTLTPASSGTMPNISIANSPQTTNYGYTWSGVINIPVAGTYTFATTSDDGSAMWFNATSATGTPLVNNDGAHGSTTVTGSKTLQPGSYPIFIEYFQAGGGAAMSLTWACKQLYGDNTQRAIPNQYFASNYNPGGTAPARPTQVTASAAAYNKVNVSWTDNSTNETGFEIYRANSMAGPFNIVTTTAPGATSYADNTVQPSTKYFYRVQAVNQYGVSGFDSLSSGGISYSYYQFTGSWSNMSLLNSQTPVSTGSLNNVSLSPATATSNFAFKFMGYINIRTAGSYTFYTASDDGSDMYVGGYDSAHLVVKNDALQGVTTKSGTVTLAAGRVPVWVTYFQSGGGSSLAVSYKGPGITTQTVIPDSAFYNLASITTTPALPSAPAAPYGLTVTSLSTTQIGVSWQDTATNFTTYQLLRSVGDSAHFIQLASFPAGITSYTDTALFASLTYYYKLNVTGVGGTSSNTAAAYATTKGFKPTIVKLANQSVRYGTTTTVQVSATSQTPGTLSFAAYNLPTSFTSFTDNGNGTGTLTFNPVAANQGNYTGLYIVVTDAFGAKDTTTFSVNVNNFYAPTLDSVANYTMNENDTLSIPLSGHDQNTSDTLSIAVSNLPAGYTLTAGANGYATLLLHPGYSAAGVYAVKVTVNDNNGLSTSRTFSLTVNPKDPNTYIYTRVKYANTMGAPWNNITGVTTPNLLDANGNTTSVGLNFLQSWWMPFNGGPSTGNNSGVYPDGVMNDFWYFGYYGGPETAAVAVTGLNKTGKYALTFFASSVFNGYADNGTTIYTIGNQSVSLYVQNNTRNTVTLTNLTPDSTGAITVNMTKAPGTPIGYLNALVITSLYDDGSAPASPSNLSVQAVSGQGAILSWIDSAYNETGYQVYRSTSQGGTYTLVGTTGPKVTGYTDSTVYGSTQYFYTVRAYNGHGTSNYTDTASVTTLDRIPQITAIANVTLKNNQSTTINVTATDDPTDHLTLTATGLPAFATFIDNGNGTGTITLQPTPGLLGAYTGISVTATDQSDSSRSTSFNIYIVDANMSSTYINVTDYNYLAPAPWNNMAIPFLPYAGTVIANPTDDGNVVTTDTVTLTDAWTGVSETGQRLNNGRQIYPNQVSRSAIYITDNNTHRITVSGLDNTMHYNFVFYLSDGTSSNSLTYFTINGTTVSLNGSYNCNNTVQINGIAPVNGQVVISCSKDANAAFGLLSGLIIQKYTPGVVSIFSPTNLYADDYTKTNNRVSLHWQDRSDNETGFEVWRALDGGAYALVATLPAKTTAYVDSNLTANTSYNYTVRAKNGSGYSSYSNTIRAYTYQSAVYVAFSSPSYSIPAPWNPLNWVYGIGSSWNNFTDVNGVQTTIGMTQPVKVDGMVSPGMTTGNNSGIVPDNVMIEGFGMFPGDTTYVVLNDLNLSKAYDITIFASLTNYIGDNTTSYMINGNTYYLNSMNNTSGTLTVFGVQPDPYGNVKIAFTGYPTSTFGMLSALIVKGYDASTNTIPTAPASTVVNNKVNANTATSNQLTLPKDSTANGATNDPLANKSLSAYPNPFDQYFNLAVPAQNSDVVVITVTSVSGQIVYEKQFEGLYDGTNLLMIQPTTQLASGVYFVKVNYVNKNQQKTLKVIRK